VHGVSIFDNCWACYTLTLAAHPGELHAERQKMTNLLKTKARLPSSHHVLVDELNRVLQSLEKNSEEIYPLRQSPQPLDFFNKYMDFAISVYSDKFKQLYNALAYSVENEWYLVYAQCARSIIENAALCRYYSRKESFAELKKNFQKAEVTGAQINTATEDLDRFVRGTRFSWMLSRRGAWRS